MESVVEDFRNNALETFRAYKKMGEKAMDQVSDEEFFHRLDEDSNSIAVIVKHISGNQRSRFTDFLTTDGEKPDRNRDSEFIIDKNSRGQLMQQWEDGWEILFLAVDNLRLVDFKRSVSIRGEPHSIVEALNRQLTHYAYHIGQIVFLAKHYRSAEWKTLSVPPNKSAEFNEFLLRKKERGEAKSHPLDGAGEFASQNDK